MFDTQMRGLDVRRKALYAALILAPAVLCACSQESSALTLGATESDVRRVLGAPSSVEAASQRGPERLKRLFAECEPASAAAVMVVWTYERKLHRALVLGFGNEKTLRCVGEGGVTFIQ